MGLPFLFYPNTAVNAMDKEGVAFPAGSAAKLQRHPNLCGHGNPTGRQDILCCELRFSSCYFLGLFKENYDSLPCDLFDVGFFHRVNQTLPNHEEN